MRWAAGIDLGGTNVKAVAVTADGEVVARRRVPTRDGIDSPRDWARTASRAIEAFSHACGGAPTAAGVCTPGLVATDGRAVISYPERLPGLEGFDWTLALGTSSCVPLLNDAHAALLAEAWIGAARGRRHALLYTLGTGVGGAILAGGRLLRGALGRAGHVGHMSVDYRGQPSIVGMPGSIEGMIGECTLRARTGNRFSTTHDLVAAYGAGDPDATKIWLRSIRALAVAMASSINMLDPEIVLVAGGMSQAGAALFVPLAAELDRVEWRPNGRRVPIEPAALGEWAGAIGAARNALLS